MGIRGILVLRNIHVGDAEHDGLFSLELMASPEPFNVEHQTVTQTLALSQLMVPLSQRVGRSTPW